MIASQSLLLLGCVALQAQAQIPGPPAQPIACGDVVNGVLSSALTATYQFTATTDDIFQPWTCGYTTADTMIIVKVGNDIIAQSDDLGPIVCPNAPKASGVTVHITAGTTYTIEVSAGAAWNVGDESAFSLELHCNGLMESYWENMFNNSGYDFSLLGVINGVWYYDGVSTCVGKGNYWGICPFHHIRCAGYTTFGWGSDQTMDVLQALAQPDGKYPGYSNGCPADLICSSSQYTCVNQNCVGLDNLCDNTDDCGDGSDEDRDLTRDLCGVECNAHAQCLSTEYCNEESECVDPCDSCIDNQDPIDGNCPSCEGFCALDGCSDPLAINFDEDVDCDDGSCEICQNVTYGPSLHLVTDYPAALNAGRCGLQANGNLELSCHTSHKYPTSIISLLSPITGAQPFSTAFNNQGTHAVTVPAYWTHSQGPVCDNTYDGVFNWGDVLKGDDTTILIRTDLPEQVMFTGWIAVDMFEQLDPLRNVNLTRWVRQKLPFRIKFETDVTAISKNMKTHHDYTTFFAIIEQKTIVVDSQVSPPQIGADIVLWASIEYPFRLIHKGVGVDVPALDNDGLLVSMLEDCMPGVGQPCNQKFLIHVDLEDECYFTGVYHVDFNIECLPSIDPENCPLNTSEHTASVEFDLETENVCPTMVLNVVSTGSVKSFQTQRIGTGPYMAAEHFAYMVDNWAFFEVAMQSIDGLIVETTITHIDLCFEVGCTNPTLIYDHGASQIDDLQLSVLDYPRDNVTGTSPLPLNSDIHMYLASSVFDVPMDGNIDFFLVIEVEVEYFNTQTLLEEGEERDIRMLSVEHLRSSPKTRKVLLDSSQAPSSSSSTATCSGTIVGEEHVGASWVQHDEAPLSEGSMVSGTMLASLATIAITAALM